MLGDIDEAGHPGRDVRSGQRAAGEETDVGEFVRLEVADGVGTIRLDRPKMNALDAQVQRELIEVSREADTARACEALGIPVALPVPPQSPRADKEAAAQLLRAVEEYLRQVLGTRVVQPPARHLRVTAESGSSLRDTA